MHVLLEFFYEIRGVCELRSATCLIAKVIWGRAMSWLHSRFHISGIYRKLKTLLEFHPRLVCFLMCLINLSFWQARSISGDYDSNQSCRKNFFIFKYEVWLFHLYIERLMFLFSVFRLKLFALQLWLHIISGITKLRIASSVSHETLWILTFVCKTNIVDMKNTNYFLGWQWCSKKEIKLNK